LTGDAAAAAELVSQEIRHLNRLVHDLIEISRFDAGTAQLVSANTDVAAAVAACLRTRGWAGVVTDIPGGLTMPLDRRRFDVILANLIGNALCHGRPPVTVQAGIQRADDGEQLALLVRDHGQGIPSDALPHVFERFYKADTARSRSEDSGLGLATAWENTRLHGGRIEAANHPGGGALFTLLLPVRQTGPAVLADAEPVTVTRS
jgi:two-component system, OmpR family, sensor histidine kinase MtrB